MKRVLFVILFGFVALIVFAETFSTYNHCKIAGKLLYEVHFDNQPDTIILTGDCGNTLFDPDFPLEDIQSVINPKNISIYVNCFESGMGQECRLNFLCGFDKNCGLVVPLVVQAHGNTLSATYDYENIEGELATCGSDFDMIKFDAPIPENGILNLHINGFDTIVNLGQSLMKEDYFNPGDTWTEYRLNTEHAPYIVSKHQYYVGNDTTIDGIQYKRIINHSVGDAVIREFGKKVYARLLSGVYRDTEEFLLYDFSVEEGDKFPSYIYPYDWEVIKTDSLELSDGEKRKRIILTEASDWIEGVGSMNGLFDDAIPHATDYTYYSLVCLKQENAVVYENPETNLDGRGCENFLLTEIPLVREKGNISVFVQDRTIHVILDEQYGEQLSSATVFDSMGNVCQYCSTCNASQMQLDMSDHGAGYYIVAISYPGNVKYCKVVVL